MAFILRPLNSFGPPYVRQLDMMRRFPHLADSAFLCPRFDFRTDQVKSPGRLGAFKSALPDNDQIPTGIAPCRFVAIIALDVP